MLIPLAVCLCLTLAFLSARKGFTGQALTLLGLTAGIVLVAVVVPYVADGISEPFENVIRNYGMMMGCPIVGITQPLSYSLMQQFSYGTTFSLEGMLMLVVLWVAVYGAAALLLFEATVRTFDRCMGRTPARPPIGWRTLIDWGSRTLAREDQPADRGATTVPPPR